MSENRKPTYLVMVTANNNNKYYKMIPESNDTFTVEFGRIGANPQRSSYSMSQWNKKYNEKIKKGYIDQSDLMEDLIEEVNDSNSDYKEIENSEIKKIVDRLQNMAHTSVQKNYKVGADKVTQAMVDKAQEKIDEIATNSTSTTVNKFNNDLVELFAIIPRKMKNVNDWLAKDLNSIGDIIQREQDLLDVMKGQVFQKTVIDNDVNNTKSSKTILETLGLVIDEVTDTDMDKIKNIFGSNASNIVNAWKVTNLKTQDKFDKYIKDHNISEIKYLLHGSGNANWWSIISNGLNIRPANAASHGRMLGNGIYLANDVEKSRTYTSRSSWTYKSEPTGFIGIMETAYGKPYDINAFDSKYYSYNYDKLRNACPDADCIHAHKGMNTGWCNLRYDEIVVYNEEQCTINYIVEFK